MTDETDVSPEEVRQAGERLSDTPEPGRRMMPLGEHLSELRRRLLLCLAVVVVLFIVGFFVLPSTVKWVLDTPQERAAAFAARHGWQFRPVPLQSLEVTEAFLVVLKLSFLGAVVIAAPLLIQQLWGFVQPGLLRKERRAVAPILVAGSALFVLGAALAYFVVLPFMLCFFYDYTVSLGIQAGWTVNRYSNFILRLPLVFGIAFELPLVIAMLSAFGLVSPRALIQNWRPVILGIVVAGAVLTPPDVFSQLILAGALLLLYLASIVVCRLLYRKRRAD